MKLELKGNVNIYYVQMLCMVFFPGSSFSEGEHEPDEPVLHLQMRETDEGVTAKAVMSWQDKEGKGECFRAFTVNETADKTRKMAAGSAIVAAGGELLSYRPSWGMLTGVRPSKVASELLNQGLSKTRVKKILNSEYLAIPKKASLATEVAVAEKKIIGIPDRRDCSVYISIPFCPSRCSYCSFVSYTSRKLLDLIPDYLDRLIEDVKATFATIRSIGLHVRSIYIGGGTPTILDEGQLRRLLETVASCVDVSTVDEWTLEAGRPDTITAEKMAIARELGVTRTCVNPQSLCDDVLREIGRNHTCEDFLRAFDVARNSGIPVINTDLIAGLPGDTFSTFAASFDRVLALAPENITVHTFCVKRASEIRQQNRHIYSLRGGDTGKCVDYTQIKSVQAGYKPYYMYRQKNTVGNYENVGFAKDGFESYYNIFMMEEVHSIFAVGAGAVAKMVDWRPEDDGKPQILRLFYPKYPYEYLRENRTAELLANAEKFYEERFHDWNH